MFLHKPLTVVHRGFNPCCSGLVGETQNAREDRSGLGVSILVVVDWSVRRTKQGCGGKRYIGFNPCCSGLVGETKK